MVRHDVTGKSLGSTKHGVVYSVGCRGVVNVPLGGTGVYIGLDDEILLRFLHLPSFRISLPPSPSSLPPSPSSLPPSLPSLFSLPPRSTGSTVVEMLKCHPPWFEFEPTAAMFKIVTEDTQPELPPHCSEHAEHFLALCFIK